MSDHKVDVSPSSESATKAWLRLVGDQPDTKIALEDMVKKISELYSEVGGYGKARIADVAIAMQERGNHQSVITRSSLGRFLVVNSSRDDDDCRFDFGRVVLNFLQRHSHSQPSYSHPRSRQVYEDAKELLRQAKEEKSNKPKRIEILQSAYRRMKEYSVLVSKGFAFRSPDSDPHLAYMVEMERLLRQEGAECDDDSQEQWAVWQMQYQTLGISDALKEERESKKREKS